MENKFNGILLIHKPSGITSHDVVNQVRRRLGIKEVGHAGTLDPIADGLMVLLLGEATKMSHYILERNKQYEVQLKFGFETDTLDLTGKILREQKEFSLNDQVVIEKARELQGDFTWEVPIFSATKVAGKKLYEYARLGNENVEIPRKLMSFWEVEYLSRNQDLNSYQFRLNCSKGSFIRSWVKQLGQNLGCGAVMVGLTRTYSAPFKLQNALSLEKLSSQTLDKLTESSSFIPILEALPDLKSLRVNGSSEALIRNGQISHELRRRLIIFYNPDVDTAMKILSQKPEELLALIGFEPGKGFVVKRVFRYH